MPRLILLVALSVSLAGFAAVSGPAGPAGAEAKPSAAVSEGIEAKLQSPDPLGAPPGKTPMLLNVIAADLVTQLTGDAGAYNDTASRWGVHGTDLGHMFWHRDRLYMVFGDTFGEGGLGGRNWRSNTLALLDGAVPAEGLRIESMIAGPDGTARELIPSRKIRGIEKTVIPTNGISIDSRMYLHYMSVTQWGGGGGQWDVRHSGFAYSDDDGHSWAVPETAIWPGGSGFEQVALIRSNDDDYVYTFGIPGGRWGGVRLRRVAPGAILDRAAYEYWNGEAWTAEADSAALVVPDPAGELSVAWSERHQLWLMMYLNPARRAAVLRSAPALVGPWGEEQVVVTAARYPGLYAPYIVPEQNPGDDIYFTLSLWKPYNVFLMRMKLASDDSTGGDRSLATAGPAM